MTQPTIHGWCPGTLRPMMSGDGLVVRIRTPFGRLKPEQAVQIARLSERFGNGVIDLSSRANLQLRGVTETSHPALIEGLREIDLVDNDTGTESQRNLTVSPFRMDSDDTDRIANSLNQILSENPLTALPSKFGFAVDCGPEPVLRKTSADIRIERGPLGLICRADGAEHGVAVTIETAAEVALSMAKWFLRTGGAPEGRGRMANHIAQIGLPKDSDHPSARMNDEPVRQPGLTDIGMLVALEFGQMAAETLADLAQFGALRLTPWRMLLIEGQTTNPTIPGIICDPEDSRLRVSACTGAPGCVQARSPTRDLARALAPFVKGRLHISGCTKGCAHPDICAVTLTATETGSFDLIRNGKASDAPSRKGLTTAKLLHEAL